MKPTQTSSVKPPSVIDHHPLPSSKIQGVSDQIVVKSDGDVNSTFVNGDNNNGLNHDDNGVKSEVTSTPNDEITTTSVVQKTFEATIIEPTSS